MKPFNQCSTISMLTGLCLVAASTALAQNSGQAVFSNISITPLNPAGSGLGSVNSAIIIPRVFNDAPGATGTYINSYPGSISLAEANVQSLSGFADRDVWYFSNNGGVSPYQFTAGDYFTASFGLTLSGGIAGKDLEGGFLFSNPSGTWGGDDSIVAVGQGGNAGTVFQGGGPSYYPFSPGAGGYPGAGGSVPNYINGTTINMTFTYTIDPITTKPAFEYAVNGQYAASAPGNNYFDLANPVGSAGDFLGGYFQIQTVIVPEPSTFALLGLGVLSMVRLLRRRA
ncbi:MAG TPA: PEP-CTERM sorting domain-containing protein [Candidatus Acidoferrales bacterium]|nr:PEP-CTERM sorting domain-containing protein [Candidatus Acidoferrales bacterium]